MSELKEIIREKLKTRKNYDEVRESLVRDGYLEEEFEKELDEIIKEDEVEKKKELKSNSKKIVSIDGISKFGSGLLSNQYLNVILYLISSSNLFLVGVVTTIRYVISLFSSFYTEKKLQYMNPSKVKLSLIGFGIAITSTVFGYALMSMNLYLFIAAFILLGYLLNIFNKIYLHISKELVKNEKRGFAFRRLAFFTLIFSLVGLFMGSVVLDFIGIGHSNNLIAALSNNYLVLILFLLYSVSYYIIAFIILSFKGLKGMQFYEKKSIITELKNSISDIKIFFSDRLLSLLFVAGFLTLFVATIGNSFYGIFIFNQLNVFGNLRFLRIAIIFAVTIVASMIGPYIVKINSRGLGKIIMLVFGTFLSSFMPFFLSISPIIKSGYNSNYLNLIIISFAALLNFIGVSIVGSAFGMVVVDLIPTEHRAKFFNSNQIALILPSIIFMPIASYIAQQFGLRVLFMSLAVITAFIITPMYMLIIFINESKKKKRLRKLFY